jgi:hypothetical protein
VFFRKTGGGEPLPALIKIFTVRYNKYTGCNPNAKKGDREGVGRRKEMKANRTQACSCMMLRLSICCGPL